MNIAKTDEIESIRIIAEQKLINFKDRATNDEYVSTLILTMQEIANDMGFYLPDDNFLLLNNFPGKLQILEIHNTQDLDYLENEWGERSPAHLIIFCNTNDLEDKIIKAYQKGQIFSLSFLRNINYTEGITNILKDIPIFIVIDQKEAYDLLQRFHSNPVTTVSKAINSELVLLKYLEGNPT